MTPYYQDNLVTLYHGDCLDVAASLPDCSVDAVCTDPPYGLEFMGKDWDAPWKHGFGETGYTDGKRMARPNFGSTRAFGAWCELWAAECLRVLKPGGHLLAMGGARTQHRLICGIEDAGFEIRDGIADFAQGGDANRSPSGHLAWMYGSGFP